MMNHDFNQKLDGFSSMLEDGFPLMKGGECISIGRNVIGDAS